MSGTTVKYDAKAGTLTIVLPIAPHPSGSGKTIVIASTHGNLPTTEAYDGKPIIVGVNAYVKK